VKGTVFVEFLDHVEDKYGLDVLDSVILALQGKLSTNGAYTSVGNYPHEEMLELASAICSMRGESLESLLDDFAQSLMLSFERMHPEFFDKEQDIFDFFSTLESRIHTDVRKIYPDARPPLILCRRIAEDSLEISYQSARPLALMAIALTRATGVRFEEELEVEVLTLADDHSSMRMVVKRRMATV